MNGQNYINEISINGKSLIINNSIEDHNDVQRIGIVKALPLHYKGNVQVGDLVVTQHNVFRISFNDKGLPVHSSNHIENDLYGITSDILYLIIRDGKYIATDEFVLLEPIKEQTVFEGEKIVENQGFAKYINKHLESQGVKQGDRLAFRKFANYLFEIFGEKLYIMNNNS